MHVSKCQRQNYENISSATIVQCPDKTCNVLKGMINPVKISIQKQLYNSYLIVNHRLLEIQIINTHILQIGVIISFQDERTFSEEEEEKLQGGLDIAASDLDLVLQTLEFFLQQVIIPC